jgi:DHA1 family putative efflux transporter-like MFS transporter
MSNTWKIYMLTLISFLVGTSQFVISGILDEVATSVGVSLSVAGQLITVFALATAIGTPVVMVATAKMGRRKQLLLAISITLLGIMLTIALPGFGFLHLSRIVLGVGSGVFVVPLMQQLRIWHLQDDMPEPCPTSHWALARHSFSVFPSVALLPPHMIGR